MAAMQPVHYKSSDGLEIPAYLTLPKGVAAKNLPLIMFPHGDVHVLASTPGLKPMQITTDAVVKLTRPDSIASGSCPVRIEPPRGSSPVVGMWTSFPMAWMRNITTPEPIPICRPTGLPSRSFLLRPA